MASYTSNLNLKKPAGSEGYSVDDWNGNMDLIDTAVENRALKGNIVNGSITATSLADYQTKINEKIATMTDGTVCICYSFPNFTGWGVAGFVVITRRSSSNYTAFVQAGNIIRLGYYYSSAWHWYNVSTTAI